MANRFYDYKQASVDQFLRPSRIESHRGMISAYPKDSMLGSQRQANIGTDPDFKRSNPASGERRLWAAVLEQALKDLNPVHEGSSWDRSPINRYRRLGRIQREALEWFRSEMFEDVCSILNLNANKIRKRLIRIEGRFKYNRNVFSTHEIKCAREA